MNSMKFTFLRDLRRTALLALLTRILPCPCRAEQAPAVEASVIEVDRFGNLVLDIRASDLMEKGYEIGDLLAVTVSGRTLVMPLVTQFSDVDSGEMLCWAVINPEKNTDRVDLSVNMGSLADVLGFPSDTKASLSISMQEKGGYAGAYLLHHLVRSDDRSDYPALSDEAYANFRMVTTTGIGAGALYRSSTPISPEFNHSQEADAALARAGVRTVLNLDDTEEEMRSYGGFESTAYSRRDVIALKILADVTDPGFKTKLAQGLAFLAAHDGPYLIHREEGRVRTGFVAAVIKCLMGADADEVIADYMLSYENYYGIQPGTEQYDLIARGTVVRNLCDAFGIGDVFQADLSRCAEEYLREGGLDDGTLAQVRARLGTDWLPPRPP